jgi:hypothetical protein
MSETHQTPGSESSPQTTTQTSTANQPNGGAAPEPKFWESFADKSLAESNSVTRWPSVEEMAKGYVSLEKRFGVPPERRIDLPEDMTKPEALREVMTKLGLPEKPDGYGFKLPEGASEQDNAMLGKYVEAAHKAGVPTPQAKQMLDWWVEQNAAAQTAAAQALTQRKTEGEGALKTAFGGAYEDRMREAKNLLTRYDPEGKTGLTADNLTTFPAWTQMLIRMSDRMQEPGGLPAGEPPEGGERPLTPAQAKAQLNTFNLDQAKQLALFDPKHPSHKAVLAERTKLLEAANPRGEAPTIAVR